MSRVLKRLIHVVEWKLRDGWRFDRHWYAQKSPGTRAKKYAESFPADCRHVVYERQEYGVHPGPCLWVVERETADGWEFVDVCQSVESRDKVAALAGGKTRFLRFVRKKVRAW